MTFACRIDDAISSGAILRVVRFPAALAPLFGFDIVGVEDDEGSEDDGPPVLPPDSSTAYPCCCCCCCCCWDSAFALERVLRPAPAPFAPLGVFDRDDEAARIGCLPLAVALAIVLPGVAGDAPPEWSGDVSTASSSSSASPLLALSFALLALRERGVYL
jgi:hypothetical protein